MANEKPVIDYSALLADLEAKKLAIEALIAYVKLAQSLGIPGLTELSQGGIATPNLAPLGYSGYQVRPDDIPAGAFHGKSVPGAIKAYLEMVKKKQTLKEITEALRRGGMESTSSRFELIVYNTLRRLQGRELLRSGDAWGMAEWWPASMRNSQSKESDKSTKIRRTKFPKIKIQRGHAAASATVGYTTPESIANRENIRRLLNAAGKDGATVNDIASTLGAGAKGVRLILGRMAASWHDAEKIGDDKYRSISKS